MLCPAVIFNHNSLQKSFLTHFCAARCPEYPACALLWSSNSSWLWSCSELPASVIGARSPHTPHIPHPSPMLSGLFLNAIIQRTIWLCSVSCCGTEAVRGSSSRGKGLTLSPVTSFVVQGNAHLSEAFSPCPVSCQLFNHQPQSLTACSKPHWQMAPSHVPRKTPPFTTSPLLHIPIKQEKRISCGLLAGHPAQGQTCSGPSGKSMRW